ncbi:MAG: hypothetical protein E7668_05750 [Ruminococcaceae bacterium]|nr:hypothetical protein [Oscillospiraceae bacterium]
MKVLHDIHTHNIMSLCCGDFNATTENYIKKAQEVGLKTFGLANHIWDTEHVKGCSGWYSPQSIRRSQDSKTVMRLLEPKGMKCLYGAESEYYGCYDRLGMTVEGAKNFDFMLVPNSHLHMRNEVMWDYPEVREMRETIKARIIERCPELDPDDVARMTRDLSEARLMKYIPEMKTDIQAFVTKANIDNFYGLVENEEFARICKTLPTSIAHPFAFGCLPGKLKKESVPLLSDETLRDCFTRAKKIGAYVEINLSELRGMEPDLTKNPQMRIFKIAKEVGCQFTFGSDAHSTDGLASIPRFASDAVEFLGLQKSDIAEFLQDSIVE